MVDPADGVQKLAANGTCEAADGGEGCNLRLKVAHRGGALTDEDPHAIVFEDADRMVIGDEPRTRFVFERRPTRLARPRAHRPGTACMRRHSSSPARPR